MRSAPAQINSTVDGRSASGADTAGIPVASVAACVAAVAGIPADVAEESIRPRIPQNVLLEDYKAPWQILKVDRNEYKRQQAAPGLKVTTEVFGIGRRFPIAQRYSA